MVDNNNIDPKSLLHKAGEQGIPEVQNELSKVGTNPKQSIIILIIAFIVCLVVFFMFFFNDHTAPKTLAPIIPTDITKPTEDVASTLREIPKLPEAPKLEAPSDLPPPPPLIKAEAPAVPVPPLKETTELPAPLPPILNNTNNQLIQSEEERRRIDAKRKSSIIAISGVPSAKTPQQIAEEAAFHDRGNMSFVLARGKIIEAVLETAINSDFGGEVRAVISRDVFSEKDKFILIPKGSKVFGNYTVGTSEAYGRVAIIWSRIDLSSGYTINLNGLTVDNLGRKGEQGRVDTKIKERLANAILMSAFNIGVAKGLDKLVVPPVNSQVTATNTAIATNIQNILRVNSGAGNEETKINNICVQVPNAITDKTSTAYTNMTNACAVAQTPGGGLTPADRLSTLIIATNTAANSLLIATATAATPTQAQAASKQAFTDITDTMKDILVQQDFKPTTTIDQGTIIKIYVNQDYKFPKNLLKKARVIR